MLISFNTMAVRVRPDFLEWQVYSPTGSSITGNALTVNGYGNVGIGKSANRRYQLDVSGVVNASGGVHYPDGNTQTVAYLPSAG